MKPLLSAAMLIVVVHYTASAQIPNAGFEQWSVQSGSPYVMPDGWVTNNSAIPYVARSYTPHSGTISAQCVVNIFGGIPFPPIMTVRFPVGQRHSALSAWIMCNQILSDDAAIVTATMFKDGSPIGFGEILVPRYMTAFEQFIAPIEYVTSDVPDTCVLYVSMVDTSGSGELGLSAFMIDDLAFTDIPSLVEDSDVPNGFLLLENYPNPFNPTCVLTYTVPKELHAVLEIFDGLGRRVAVLVDGTIPAGTHTASFTIGNGASGAYFARLRAGGMTATHKLVAAR